MRRTGAGMKQPDPNRHDAIEALLPELQRLEIPNLERRQVYRSRDRDDDRSKRRWQRVEDDD
jgi:hypothetical protein